MRTNNTLSDNQVKVNLLGTFIVEKNNLEITDEINRSQKLWGLLAYLIINQHRAVPISELIDAFWPDDDSGNPQTSLKALIFRLRSMLEPVFGADVNPILSQRGSYSWNRDYPCVIDTERFETLCQQATNSALTDEEKMALYQEATSLYHGDFLPKLADQLWTVSYSSHYHLLYLKAVKAYSELLLAHDQFHECVSLCYDASRIDPLDEEIHVFIIRGLIYQGKDSTALSHYKTTTDQMYKLLGVQPSEALRTLYLEIMKATKALETDLDVIQAELIETESRPGAFVCDYGFFKEAYRLEARRSARNGQCVHIALLTITHRNGNLPNLDMLSTAMLRLQNALVSSLRRGDVVSKYSGAQFVVMLPGSNYENSVMVLERVLSTFSRQYHNISIAVSYKIREINIEDSVMMV